MKAKEVIEEVIERLNYLIGGDCTDNQMNFVEEITMGIEALEKRMPKKPDICGEDLFICPNCKLELFSSEEFESNKYCYNCGQALDWSDSKTEKGGDNNA